LSNRLQDKVALITGASRGIGRATALAFAAEGSSVIVNYNASAPAADEVVRLIAEGGHEAAAIKADVTNRDQVDALTSAALQRFGRIDVLVNNAGIGIRGDTLTMSLDDLDAMMAVNVKGVIHCVQAIAPHMIQRGGGSIVNIASIAGLGTALSGNTPYAASKAALIGLTRRFALDLGDHGINVNTICPGVIITDMTRGTETAQYANVIRHSMLGRVGRPEEIAGPAVFLASAEAAFMTGQVITIDGGRTDFLSHSA
jgi:3-oxoacyl-[acyl-carrier protein] reductase